MLLCAELPAFSPTVTSFFRGSRCPAIVSLREYVQRVDALRKREGIYKHVQLLPVEHFVPDSTRQKPAKSSGSNHNTKSTGGGALKLTCQKQQGLCGDL
jgi:hypothetical protein